MAIDPKEFVLGFDALWNTGNREAILAAIEEESVVELIPAPPPGRPRYQGREEIGSFVDSFLPGFHVDSRDFRTEGGDIVWESDVRNDVFRGLGLDPASGTTRAKLDAGGKLRHFSFTLDQAAVARLSGTT